MRVHKRIATLAAAFAGVLVVLNSFPAMGKKNPAVPVASRLFDHSRHPGGGALDCAKCHMPAEGGTWKHSGKKEHKRCSGCHSFASPSCSVLARKEGKVCVTCHVKHPVNCIPKGYRKPLVGASNFYAKYSHQIHAQTRAQTGAQCEGCHGVFGQSSTNTGTLAAGHATCSGCHSRGVSPIITSSCEGCHKLGSAAATTLPKSEYSVAFAFDHQAHAGLKRVGTDGKDCLVCHSNIKDSKSDSEIPMPTMASCMASCHDGTKAFSAIGTTCTRCHQKGGTR